MPNYAFLRGTLRPLTAFGTPLKGDTLFGQLCWGIVHRHGEERLKELLRGYTGDDPFLVVSDAFPSGYLPRPTAPHRLLQSDSEKTIDRKNSKRNIWLRWEDLSRPLDSWGALFLASEEIFGGAMVRDLQHHNSLNRKTGTTGTGMFAPYATTKIWFRRAKSDPEPSAGLSDVRLDLYLVCDQDRLTLPELSQILGDMGATGFGRDASTGLGKFDLLSLDPTPPLSQSEPNAVMTLAPSLPQGSKIDPNRSFYLPFTRFGRHGDMAVLRGKPYKTPVLLADTGALLSLREPSPLPFIGHGLGGDGSLSKSLPATVHQGYAPVVSLAMNPTPTRGNRQ